MIDSRIIVERSPHGDWLAGFDGRPQDAWGGDSPSAAVGRLRTAVLCDPGTFGEAAVRSAIPKEFVVAVNVQAVRHRLAESGRELTLEQIAEWLRQCGLQRDGDVWIGNKLDLKLLKRNEYTLLRKL
jgi:hypothetical protein